MIRFEEKKYETECKSEAVEALRRATGLSEPAARLLCKRGVTTATDAKRFLHPGPEQLLDPLLLPDMEKSVARINTALARNEKITVFCDYDADGTCGGCALFLYLKSRGADVSIMTPNRHREGYGLSLEAVQAIAKSGASLIITVDCGITNVAETALARSLGVDVIITDHHECGALPDTPYIINPKRPDSSYPCAYLAGCGVAFKLIHALSSLSEAMKCIDLIAVGTVTDIVPLLGENRAIAHLGIKKLRSEPCAGIKALAECAGIELAKISSFGVSFGLGPRINAAGRMDTAELAIDILSAQHSSPALRKNAEKLCSLNERRRKEVEDIQNSAEEMIQANAYMNDSAIMLADESWNAGVIGIAAAKIAEKYTRPCVLFGGNGGSLVGSARSIEGINMFEVLGAFAERYEKFGGHAQAAGLTIAPGVLEGLRRDVCEYIDTHYNESVFERKKAYDLRLNVDDITLEFVRDLERLEPFGQCNEKPVIAVSADIADSKFVGNGRKPHLKFRMRQAKHSIEAVNFFYKDSHSFISKSCDFLCEADINEYSGAPQLIVRDIAVKYDEALAEGFLAANRSEMIQNFLDEITRIGKEGAPESMSEEQFTALFASEHKTSRFGLCVEASTTPAFKRLLSVKAVDEALRCGELLLFDAKAYTACNCVAVSLPAGFQRKLRAGAGAGSFFDGKMLALYREEARRYFAPREEMLRAFETLSGGPVEPSEAERRLGVAHEKFAFMHRVLSELELIETDKSGRIHAIKGRPKKDLMQSSCFYGFKGFIG